MAQGRDKADAVAHATATKIWAEMLGLVCHPEYYHLGEQKVLYQLCPLTQAFVVQFSGYHACIYYATFPSEYLYTIQHEGIQALKYKFNYFLPLHHTKLCNLMDAEDRMMFVGDFIAIVRCLADGNAPIGYLRSEVVVQPPQQIFESTKESEWREASASGYAK